MTKLEYMQYVREKLQGYDREFVEEILENYEEHFEAGLKNGRSEEEICEELGNIENLLGDIQDVMGDKDLKTHEIDQFTAIEQPQESYSGIEEIELSLLSMDVPDPAFAGWPAARLPGGGQGEGEISGGEHLRQPVFCAGEKSQPGQEVLGDRFPDRHEPRRRFEADCRGAAADEGGNR